MQSFDYHRASTLADATHHAGTAQALAGGQSLLPAMKLGLAAPDALVDVGGKGRTRDAGRGDLEFDGADSVPIADPHWPGAEGAQRKVFAEPAGTPFTSHLPGPPGVILGTVHVNSLIGPTVVFLIGHQIPGQPEEADLGGRHNRFVDAGSGEP